MGVRTGGVRVTPYVELDEMQQRTMDKMPTYHGATHFKGGSDRIGQIITAAVGPEASGGLVDEVFVLAQALGVVLGA